MNAKTRFIPFRLSLLFAVLALAVFFLFIILHPLDWQMPETLRMHYHSLQTGVRDGPLISTPVASDLLKPLSNKARGGTYEARYLVKLLDGMKVRFYQSLYRINGPFLGEPLNLFFIIATAVLLVLAIHEWFGSWPAALVASGAWLLTSQTLLDARYPVRPNMTLATALSVYLVWEILRLRRLEKGSWVFIKMGVALFIAISSQEATLCLIPALGAVIVMEWRFLSSHWRGLLVSIFGALAVYALFYQMVLPFLMRHLIGEEPLLFQLQNSSPLGLLNPRILLQRTLDGTLPGLSIFARLNLGISEMLVLWQRLAGGVASVLLFCLLLPSARRAIISPAVMALAFYIPFSLIMFPLAPGSVEMPVYYYAVVVVLFAFPLGAMFAAIPIEAKHWKWPTAITVLGVVCAVNLSTATAIMKELPGAFGFNEKMREYTRDIISMDDYIESGQLPPPIYISYPRPRRFDISTKYDIMLRVWHGESERIFALMVPVLQLRNYEAGLYAGDPEEFSLLSDNSSGIIEKASPVLADLPARGWYNLSSIRKTLVSSSEAPVWISADGEELRSREEDSLLGMEYRVVLPPGKWRSSIRFPSPSGAGRAVLLLSRADLQPEGSDDIFYRETPLPGKNCLIRATGPTGSLQQVHTYGWSYQWQEFPVEEIGMGGAEEEIVLEVDTEGLAEIVGPVLVNRDLIKFEPWPGVSVRTRKDI